MRDPTTKTPMRLRTPAVYLNLNVRGLPISATMAINERCAVMRGEGREVYPLGLGQSPFPVPECVVEALRQNAHQKDYLPVKGLPALREAVAQNHCRVHQMTCSPDNVLVGPGSKELMFLLQLVYYGDIIIPTPAWVSYAPQAGIIGRHVNLVQTRAEDEWRLTPDELESICHKDRSRPRIVVLNYPCNPTGGTYTAEELRALAAVAQKYRIVLLSDEIYGQLHHTGEHASIVPEYPEGTIFSSGLSKWCGAGGWRLGVLVIPDKMLWLLDAMAAVASETYTTTSAPIQYAAVRAFQGNGEIDAYLRQCRRVLRAIGGHLVQGLEAAGARVLHPEGAFYLFPDFGPLRRELEKRGIATSDELCHRLLEETGVALLPGTVFGRPAGELTARIAYVDIDGSRVLEAAERIPADQPLGEAFLKEHCSRMLRAGELICDWLAG